MSSLENMEAVKANLSNLKKQVIEVIPLVEDPIQRLVLQKVGVSPRINWIRRNNLDIGGPRQLTGLLHAFEINDAEDNYRYPTINELYQATYQDLLDRIEYVGHPDQFATSYSSAVVSIILLEHYRNRPFPPSLVNMWTLQRKIFHQSRFRDVGYLKASLIALRLIPFKEI